MSTPLRSVSKILVPTDFSTNAYTALQWAIRLAKTHEAAITLLHVADSVALTSLPVDVQEHLTRGLDRLETAAREAGVDITTIQTHGRPWERIAAAADKCDLVVIGARGRTPHAVHILGIGSTADRVLRSSPVPVLTVHADDAPPAGPLRRVILPTDFSDTASLAPAAMLRLLGPAADGVEIVLLHAWQPLVDYGDLYGAVPPPNPYVGTEAQALELLESVAAAMRDGSREVTTALRQGYPARVIEEEARAMEADLIAMGTHGHAGLARFMLGSVAERVVHRVDCPVLTIGLATQERSETTKSATATAS